MAVFLGDTQTTTAAICGLQINWAVQNIVNPALKRQYPSDAYAVKQIIGMDTSELRTARIGVRGYNDLVWIGRAANYAAKLCECRNDHPTWLTADAYNRLEDRAKLGGQYNQNMWTSFNWGAMNNVTIYGSNWTWSIS
jgi:class 3 adenylate cyclase